MVIGCLVLKTMLVVLVILVSFINESMFSKKQPRKNQLRMHVFIYQMIIFFGIVVFKQLDEVVVMLS